MLLLPDWILCALVVSVAAEAPTAAPPAKVLWQSGQEHLQNGDSDKAIFYFKESLKLDPDLACNYLSLAAAYADQGKDILAALNLGFYVEKRPDHLAARLYYADMLVKQQRPQEARVQFERFIADGQDRAELADEHLVHCHTCLVAIYEAEADEYHEHLNRGLGLFQLACERETLPDPNGECSVESLLFRAAGELMAARRGRRDEARASWYLHRIWSRLGQKQQALRWLRVAVAAAPFDTLTPAERRGLHLAWVCYQQEGRK
jgi:tetratricopeptide (TPR) repeat protein